MVLGGGWLEKLYLNLQIMYVWYMRRFEINWKSTKKKHQLHFFLLQIWISIKLKYICMHVFMCICVFVHLKGVRKLNIFLLLYFHVGFIILLLSLAIFVLFLFTLLYHSVKAIPPLHLFFFIAFKSFFRKLFSNCFILRQYGYGKHCVSLL